MMKFLRSQSQTVLIVILGVLAIGFILYGNSGSFLSSGASAPTDFGRIDGEDLSVADLYNAVRNARNYLALSGHDQEVPQAQIAQRAWRQLLLLHEADKLHIDVSDRELIAFIQSRPEFQKNGVYSPDQFQQAMLYLKNVHHISEENYESLMRDELRIDAVSNALFSPIRAANSDIQTEYDKYYGPVQVSYVTFDPKSYVAAAKISPKDVEAAYKADPMNPAYRTGEKRKVDYVLFPLTPDQAKLPEKDKNAAIQVLGEKALNFALALQPDPNATGATPPAVDFQAEAKKRGLGVVTSNFFTVETTPENLPPSPSFNNAAFALTKEDPVSKVIELSNGVAVLHLNEIQASELRPLAEVKSAIEKDLQQKTGAMTGQLHAATTASTLKDAVAKGTDFKAAVAAQHMTVQTLPAFVPANTASGNDPRLQTIAYATLGLAVGEVSKPVSVESDNTMLILHLDSRGKGDPAGLAAFEQRYHSSQDQQVRGKAEFDWANWQSKQPGTHEPPHLEEYGGVTD